MKISNELKKIFSLLEKNEIISLLLQVSSHQYIYMFAHTPAKHHHNIFFAKLVATHHWT